MGAVDYIKVAAMECSCWASFAQGFFRISLDFLRASSGFCQLSGLLSVSLFSRASLGVNEGLIEVR